jgi:hypothetical protein
MPSPLPLPRRLSGPAGPSTTSCSGIAPATCDAPRRSARAALLEAGADLLFVDIAHGHSVIMEQAVAGLRRQFGSVPLVCGNVATGAGARFMGEIGADAKTRRPT